MLDAIVSAYRLLAGTWIVKNLVDHFGVFLAIRRPREVP